MMPLCSSLLSSLPCCLWPVDKPTNPGATSTGRMERKYGLTPTIDLGSISKCLNKGGSHLLSSSDEVFSALISALWLSGRLDIKSSFFSTVVLPVVGLLLWFLIFFGHVAESSAVWFGYGELHYVDWCRRDRCSNIQWCGHKVPSFGFFHLVISLLHPRLLPGVFPCHPSLRVWSI